MDNNSTRSNRKKEDLKLTRTVDAISTASNAKENINTGNNWFLLYIDFARDRPHSPLPFAEWSAHRHYFNNVSLKGTKGEKGY